MILDYIKALLAFLSLHPEISYGLVFLAATVESMPLLGSIIPGSTIILAVAATAPSGAVSFWPLIFWSVLGAIIGDGASYWLGRRYQRRILLSWPCNRYPQLAARSEAFFARHGGKSIVIGRFTPALRPFVPLFAGILELPPRRFYAANILSALLWAPAHIIPGIALGATLGLAAAVVGRLIGLGAIIVLTLYLAIWVTRIVIHRAVPHVDDCIAALRQWAGNGDQWIRRQVAALLDPARNEARALALVGLILIGAAWLFLGVLEDVVTGDPLVQLDHGVYALLQSARSPMTDAVMTAITEMGDTFVAIAVAGAAILWLLYRRIWRGAAYLGLAVAGAWLFNGGLTLILSRARPVGDLYGGLAAYSFPSTDATVNFALYGFICVLTIQGVRASWRIPVTGLALSLVTLIALSRLYLGAHWLSDVLAGFAFATVWIVLLGTGYHVHHREKIESGSLLTVAALALLLAGATNAYLQYPTDIERYASRTTIERMSSTEWSAGGWQAMPVRRTDMTGDPEGPLTVQWVGNLDQLQQQFVAHGWQKARSLSVSSALGWIAPNPDPAQLPTVPLLHGGLAPSLTLIQVQSPSSRLVFRLWRTDILIDTAGRSPEPLWVGTVTTEDLRPLVWPLTVARVQPDANTPRDNLIGLMSNSHLERRQDVKENRSWDGQVLLMSAQSL